MNINTKTLKYLYTEPTHTLETVYHDKVQLIPEFSSWVVGN